MPPAARTRLKGSNPASPRRGAPSRDPAHRARNGARGLSSRARSSARRAPSTSPDLTFSRARTNQSCQSSRGALDRLAKISIGGLEVTVQLLDEGELKPGLRRPRLEGARVTRVLGGGLKAPRTLAAVPAVAELDLGEEEDRRRPRWRPSPRAASPRRARIERVAVAGARPLPPSTACGHRAERRLGPKRRRPGEECRREHDQAEARGQLPGPVDRRRDDARRQDRQRGAQRPSARAGRAPAGARLRPRSRGTRGRAPGRRGRARPSPRRRASERRGPAAPGSRAGPSRPRSRRRRCRARVLLESIERRRPELIATAAPPAGQVGRDVGGLRLQRLDLLELLPPRRGPGEQDPRDDRDHRPPRRPRALSRAEAPRSAPSHVVDQESQGADGQHDRRSRTPASDPPGRRRSSSRGRRRARACRLARETSSAPPTPPMHEARRASAPAPGPAPGARPARPRPRPPRRATRPGRRRGSAAGSPRPPPLAPRRLAPGPRARPAARRAIAIAAARPFQ